MSRKLQKIGVRDYGDPWVNRLAVVDTTFSKMEPNERGAVLRWLRSKYPVDWPRTQEKESG